jgi:gamma-glutamyl-gamma-aminobutyrate hydrolase PuuD
MKTSNPTFYSIDDFGGHGSMEWLLIKSGFVRVQTPYEAAIVVFNGGSDIGTHIYGEEPVLFRGDGAPSRRDLEEIRIFEELKSQNSLLLGICRGAQLLNCLNGGKLWQDVNKHARSHAMIDCRTGKTYTATSTHHQMMRPSPDGEVLAVANESTIKQNAEGVFTFNPDKVTLNEGKDVEIVWYKKTHSLCIQGHPEYVPGTAFADYCIDLTNEYLKEALLCVA